MVGVGITADLFPKLCRTKEREDSLIELKNNAKVYTIKFNLKIPQKKSKQLFLINYLVIVHIGKFSLY